MPTAPYNAPNGYQQAIMRHTQPQQAVRQAPHTPRQSRVRRLPIPLAVGSVVSASLVMLLLSIVLYSFVGATAIRIGAFVIGPQEEISGMALGQPLAQRQQGYTAVAPLAHATITCAGVSAKTNVHGVYSLRLPAASTYHCTVNAGAIYPQVNVTLTGHGATPLTLSLTSATASAKPTCVSRKYSVTCDSLALLPGSLHGNVTNQSGARMPNAQVRCWVDDTALASSQQFATMFTAQTNANGAYTLGNLPPDHYACEATNNGNLSRIVAQPAQAANLPLTVCQRTCPGVVYHQGAVLHTMVAYLDFWLPAGKHFEADGQQSSDLRYEHLIEQYFNDLNGTAFYNLLTQYWDTNGPVRDNVRLGGVTFDTTPYPHAGSILDPLSDGNVRTSAARAAQNAHWQLNNQHDEVFVFTAYNVQECAALFTCSYDAYCAYHDITNSNMLYAYLPDTCGDSIEKSLHERVYPYNDPTADATINTLSHEQFETVTDPDTRTASGWHKNQDEGEIGDLCAWKFGPTNSQGGTVTLAHGDSYTLQYEWSNAINGCAYI